jgi:membrane-associated phospholipid phosphatase
MSLADLDRALLVWTRTHGHSAGTDRAVAEFSKLGEHGAGWIALGLAGVLAQRDRTRRSAWLRGAGAVAVSYAVNQAIKFTVRRRRPELPGLPPLTPTVSQLSFPSAHATTSFAGARAYAQLGPGKALYALATLLALSRPYLGVHYPSDVIAGALLGMAIGIVAESRTR